MHEYSGQRFPILLNLYIVSSLHVMKQQISTRFVWVEFVARKNKIKASILRSNQRELSEYFRHFMIYGQKLDTISDYFNRHRYTAVVLRVIIICER